MLRQHRGVLVNLRTVIGPFSNTFQRPSRTPATSLRFDPYLFRQRGMADVFGCQHIDIALAQRRVDHGVLLYGIALGSQTLSNGVFRDSTIVVVDLVSRDTDPRSLLRIGHRTSRRRVRRFAVVLNASPSHAVEVSGAARKTGLPKAVESSPSNLSESAAFADIPR